MGKIEDYIEEFEFECVKCQHQFSINKNKLSGDTLPGPYAFFPESKNEDEIHDEAKKSTINISRCPKCGGESEIKDITKRRKDEK